MLVESRVSVKEALAAAAENIASAIATDEKCATAKPELA